MIGRALLIAILVMTINQAGAQFGGMPGTPRYPEFGLPPWPPPAQGVALKGILSDLQERGQAIGAAYERKANAKVTCQLFRNFLAASTKAVKTLDADGAACGAPPQVQQRLRDTQVTAQKIGQQVCDAAARRPADVVPTLRGWAPEDGRRELDDPTWRLHPTPAFEGPRPFRMSPERGP
jgi:hypothetical protein